MAAFYCFDLTVKWHSKKNHFGSFNSKGFELQRPSSDSFSRKVQKKKKTMMQIKSVNTAVKSNFQWTSSFLSFLLYSTKTTCINRMKEAKEDCLSFTVHPRRLKFRLTKKTAQWWHHDWRISYIWTYLPHGATNFNTFNYLCFRVFKLQITVSSPHCVSSYINSKLKKYVYVQLLIDCKNNQCRKTHSYYTQGQ